MSPSPSTRWCPTPEQLMILEELYRTGLRSPNSFQIQKITDHLSIYGKIQGKSVFYWFQNHKARDRQKLRKKLAKQLHLPNPAYPIVTQNLFSTNFQSHSPSPSGFHRFSISSTEEILIPHQGAVCLPKDFPNMSWIYDLTKDCDCSMKPTYGHDLAMATNIGSGFTCCRNRPLQTLQLFPLISTHAKNQETAS